MIIIETKVTIFKSLCGLQSFESIVQSYIIENNYLMVSINCLFIVYLHVVKIL